MMNSASISARAVRGAMPSGPRARPFSSVEKGRSPRMASCKGRKCSKEPRRRTRDGGAREELSKRWIGTRGLTAGAVWSTREGDVREGAPLSRDGPGRPTARQHVFRGLVRQPGRPIQDGFSGNAVRGNEVNQQKIYFKTGALQRSAVSAWRFKKKLFLHLHQHRIRGSL